MAKKAAKGGKRAGAGRKPTYEGKSTIGVGVSIPTDLLQRIDNLRGRANRSRSEVIVSLIGTLMDDPEYDQDVVSEIRYGQDS